MKKKKLGKKAKKRLLLLVLIIIVILVIKAITNLIGNLHISNKICLLLDNELVNTKNEIIERDGTIYLSKDDIENIFDSTIYYNDAEKELITTYNKHIALLKVDETFMIVNDSNVELLNPMIIENKEIYLPLSEMGIVYDIEFEYSEESKVFIADSIVKEKQTAMVLKNYKLKNKPSIFASTSQALRQGEYIRVIEDSTKKYYKVRSSEGNIGYVKKKRLSNPKIERENWTEEKKEYSILKDASDISKDYSKAKLDKKAQNVVIPTFFSLEKDDSILDKTGSTTSDFTKYIAWAEKNNVEIWATLKNDTDVSKALLTYTNRNKAINNIYQKLVEHQFAGININFEKIDDINSFNRFVIELAPRLKELGIKISVTDNGTFDKEKLSKIVDLIIE